MMCFSMMFFDEPSNLEVDRKRGLGYQSFKPDQLQDVIQ